MLRGKCVACSIARCGEICPPRATSANLTDPWVVFVGTRPPPYEISWLKSGWKIWQAHEQAKLCNTKPAQACRPPTSRMPSSIPMGRRLLMRRQKTLGQSVEDSALAFRFQACWPKTWSIDEETGIVVPDFVSPMPKHSYKEAHSLFRHNVCQCTEHEPASGHELKSPAGNTRLARDRNVPDKDKVAQLVHVRRGNIISNICISASLETSTSTYSPRLGVCIYYVSPEDSRD